MSVNICNGSTVYGKSGNPLVVDRIDGDILHIGKALPFRAFVEAW